MMSADFRCLFVQDSWYTNIVFFKLYGRSCTQNECELKGLSVSNHSRLNTEEHLSHLILLGPVTEVNLSNQL